MVDPRGWQVLKYLMFTYPYRYHDGDLKLFTFSFSFGDVYIITRWEDPITSYGGSKRGGGCVIAGAYY
jgi:hypothetical protein